MSRARSDLGHTRIPFFTSLIIRKWERWLLYNNNRKSSQLSMEGFRQELQKYFDFQDKYIDEIMHLPCVKSRLKKILQDPESSFWLQKRRDMGLNHYLLLGDILITCAGSICRKYNKILKEMGPRSQEFWRPKFIQKPLTKTKVLLATSWPVGIFTSRNARKNCMRQLLHTGTGPLCKNYQFSKSLPKEILDEFFDFDFISQI